MPPVQALEREMLDATGHVVRSLHERVRIEIPGTRTHFVEVQAT